MLRMLKRRKGEKTESDNDLTFEEKLRTIYLVDEIDYSVLDDFLPCMDMLDSDPGPIRIVLSSPGGEVEPGFAMYEAIKMARNPVTIEGTGFVGSMAALVLQAGRKRLLSPLCRFMIHDGRASNDGVMKEVLAFAKECQVQHQKYCEVLAQRTGMSVRKVKRYCNDETYMSAAQAVSLGFADGILEPKKLTKEEA